MYDPLSPNVLRDLVKPVICGTPSITPTCAKGPQLSVKLFTGFIFTTRKRTHLLIGSSELTLLFVLSVYRNERKCSHSLGINGPWSLRPHEAGVVNERFHCASGTAHGKHIFLFSMKGIVTYCNHDNKVTSVLVTM